MRPRLTLPAFAFIAALTGASPSFAADEGFIIDLPRASPAAPAPVAAPPRAAEFDDMPLSISPPAASPGPLY